MGRFCHMRWLGAVWPCGNGAAVSYVPVADSPRQDGSTAALARQLFPKERRTLKLRAADPAAPSEMGFMEANAATSLTPRELARVVWSQRKLWLATTGICGVLAAAFSLVMPRYWEASQGLVVRQETAGSTAARPGKFADLYEMRTMQETILELAKSRRVVVATLEAAARQLGEELEAPTSEDVDKFRQRLKMLPPDGGEFGKTEVFYFLVKDPSRERAMCLVGEWCRQLDAALKELRAQRAAGLIAEIQEQATLAEQLLETETQQLIEFETQAGADLGELRMLHSANAGQSDLRTEVVQLEADVRKFRTQVREAEQLLALLHAAQEDPRQLIATPNSLLTAQPALRRLKDGLVDAQLATSRLGGTRSSDHPRVRAAAEAEQQIRVDLHDELLTAIRGAEVELQLGRDRLEATEHRLATLQSRLSRLAELRAEYSNRVAAVENSRLTVDRARQDLSTAKAAEAAAHSGSLVTKLDEPETGPHPAGPGRTLITLAGAVAGLMLGLGLVFLAATPLTKTAGAGDAPQALAPVIESPKHSEAAVALSAENLATPSTSPPEWWDATPSEIAPTATPPSPVASDPQVDRHRDAAVRSAAPVAPHHKSAALPKVSGRLPSAAGALPSLADAGGYAGLTLQEALQAAARQVPS
jgi:polysaccharide biosynthesis transport protein